MSSFDSFYQLHRLPEPLLLANIWDVNSARIFEASGYQAIGTSSHALANVFGYDDGENLPFEMLIRVAKKVVETVRIPVTIDIEGGYGQNSSEIIEHIKMLHDAGVAGINLEDTFAKPVRELRPAEEFRRLLSEVASQLDRENMKVFLNIRTDAFLLGLPNALDETIARINLYENTGIHGLFVPCITDVKDIATITSETMLPVNVMCMPALPSFAALRDLNVKRISMGPFLFNKMNQQTGALAAQVIRDQDFSALF
nr:isocitrate lyase/phosphoenolpyruvate mutase family protein [uncultured Dyadobacter sp.]